MIVNIQQDYVASAVALVPQIRALREELESERRMPAALAQALAQAGLLRLYLPRSMGGPEVDPITYFHVIEELSRVDGSVGWCAFLSSDATIFAGWLKSDVGKAMFGEPPDARMAASFRAIGDARPVDGGYLVNGRWDYASGIDHANWLATQCRVVNDNGPRLGPAGAPETRMVMMPAESATIHDTWFPMGMRGTGINDFVVENVFVPEERTWELFGPSQEASPLYNPRLFFVMGWTPVVANALGMARGAMDAFVELATQAGTTSSTTLLRDRPHIQTSVGQAEAIISAARTYVLDSVAAVWTAACECKGDLDGEIAQARLAITHAMWESVKAVDILFHAAGTNAIHQKFPLERFFRDIHVAVQHGAGLLSNYESGGQVMLGLRPPAPGW